MKQTINWRQLYNESQAIQPEDTDISTERISRLVNIYKNDFIEQDLHQYAQRLARFSRCCQICTIKSYTIYKWIDTHISGEKNLYDFRLSGRSVSPLIYYWNKILLKQTNKRGQILDFKQNDFEKFSIPFLSNIDENIIIKDRLLTSMMPNFISELIIRFQMYYAYHKARSYCLTAKVHIQPMKTFRYLFQTNIAPIFICFINEDNSFQELFWLFRHMITIFNWPLTTKVFSTCSVRLNSMFERLMINSLGFIDLSALNQNQVDRFSYIYRCLKTCHDNGPMIFLFDASTMFKPKSSDYYLMAFLCDLIRFDLSIPDIVIIPTCLYKSYLSFSQPFLFKELIESLIKNFPIEKQFFELIKSQEKEEEKAIVYRFIDSLLLHLGYDANQLISTRIEYQHIIAIIELCQINVSSTVETVYNKLQLLIKTCPFITTDNHKWNEITKQNIEEYYSKFSNINLKLKLISIVRKEYFLDIISALTVLSKIDVNENRGQIFENNMLNQLKFFLFIFNNQQYTNIRPCQSLQQIIQYCQLRNYISIDSLPQKSMAFRDTILSDHEWSDEEEEDAVHNGIDEDFFDHDDEEFLINDIPHKLSEKMQPFYQINYQENADQFKFFAQLVGSYIEAMISILKYHIDKQLTFFTLDGFDFNQNFSFNEPIHLFSNDDILSYLRRAYAYRLLEHLNIFDDIPTFFEVTDEQIYPLSMDNLQVLYDEFVHLINSFI